MADTKKVKSRKIKNFRDNNMVVNHEIANGTKEIKKNSRKVKTKKIRMSFSRAEEQKMDREIEQSDNFSVTVMLMILLFCFVVGITLGYVLYRLAINGGF